MNKDVPVAQLNFLSVRLGKFSWDLSPLEIESTSRKHRNKGPPECHIRLGARRNNAVPLASKSGGGSARSACLLIVAWWRGGLVGLWEQFRVEWWAGSGS